ncbi:MAG: homoserine dehydrogenase [Sorangiineae bacterium]|nr:homoserine dehydrogenase [Polyangiaceae bacterium]MEB2324797.1 homoserine dehydrogenase [Sorangiineae bacterium]
MTESSRIPIRVALLGCGTVGGGVIRLLEQNAAHLASRVGAPLTITRVLVRDRERARVPECRPEWLTTDPELALRDADVVVELLGGEEPARTLIERAIAARQGIVTANKLMLARHGPALLARAMEADVDLAFEASVGGGIPVIRTLREALTSDSVLSVHAILNGTCNYILTRMRDERLPLEVVLADAQRLGFAEAEPSLDVDGHDAAQKLIVLGMLAFGAEVGEAEVPVEGIRAIDALDFRFAEHFGYTIKHLAIGRDLGERVALRVHPTLVKRGSVLASVDGVLNGVFIVGRALGPCLLVGRGAGDLPTAVSVVADLVDVARSKLEGTPGLATRAVKFRRRPVVPLDELESRHYLRFDVADGPGVLGVISGALGRHEVSIEQMLQEGRGGSDDETVPVVIMTHATREGRLRAALDEIARAPFMRARPRLIRIEDV